MSELQDLARRIRGLSSASTKHMRAIQEAGKRTSALSRSFPPSLSDAGLIVSLLQAAQENLAQAGFAIAAFGEEAAQFADSLSAGNRSNATEFVRTLGNHGGSVTASSDHSTVVYVDPETGNEVTWTLDLGERPISMRAILHGLSDEKRTSRESNTATAIGKIGRDLGFNDEGGHIASVGIVGSLGQVNIVTQNYDVNRRSFRDFERRVESQLKQGKSVTLSVDLLYRDNNQRPSMFIVKYSDDRGNGQHDYVVKRIPNTAQRSDQG